MDKKVFINIVFILFIFIFLYKPIYSSPPPDAGDSPEMGEYIGGSSECDSTDPDNYSYDLYHRHPTFIQMPRHLLNMNYEKPLLELQEETSIKVIFTFDKALVQTSPKIRVDSSIPSWLNISGLNNEINFNDNQLRAIEVTFTVSSGNSKNSFSEIKFSLIDGTNTIPKTEKTLRLAVNKTLIADITVPQRDSVVRASVPVFGYAYGTNFSYYIVKYGAGSNPTNWTIITNSTIPQKENNSQTIIKESRLTIYGNLATWGTGLTAYDGGETYNTNLNGIYTVRLEVYDTNGNYIADETVVQVGRVISLFNGGDTWSSDEKCILSFAPFSLKRPDNYNVFAIEKVDKKLTDKIADTNLMLVGNIYEIRPPQFQLGEKALLKIKYTTNDLDINNDSLSDIPETNLAIYYYSDILSKWVYADSIINTISNHVITYINKLPDNFAFYGLFDKKGKSATPLIYSLSTPTNKKWIDISGESEIGSIVELYINSVKIAEKVNQSEDGIFSFKSVELSAGTNKITAKVKDYKSQYSDESSPVFVEFIPNSPTSIISLNFMNSNYSDVYNGNVKQNDILYIELIGVDSSSSTIDTVLIKISSSKSYPNGFELQLFETDTNTGIYRGTVKVGNYTDKDEKIIKAEYNGETIKVISITDSNKYDELILNDSTFPLAPEIISSTHPSVSQNTFENKLGEWKNYGGEDGAQIIQDYTTVFSGKYSLKLLNTYEKGFFSALAITNSFNAKKSPYLSFDYKIATNVLVDMLLEINDRSYSINMTGEYHPDWTGVPTIADFNITNDNNWHTAKIDLYNVIKNASVSNFIIDRIMFIDLSGVNDRGEIDGNNPAGIFYNIDNFLIISAYSNNDVFLKMDVISNYNFGYSYVISTNKNDIPDYIVDFTNNSISFTNLTDNDWYFKVRAKDELNNWSSVQTYKIKIDTTPPYIYNLKPTSNSYSATNLISFSAGDNRVGIDSGTLQFFLNSIECSLTNGFNYNETSKTFILDATKIKPFPPVFTNNQKVSCSVVSLKDRIGNDIKTTYNWSWVYDISQDNYPPAPPVIIKPITNQITNNYIQFQWQTYDLSGIEGYSFILSTNVNNEPDDIVDTITNNYKYTNLVSGKYYFNIKAKDKAGNWSLVTHYAVYINSAYLPDVFYVNNESGSDEYDGLSWHTPFKTIQKAIDRCIDKLGNSIYVAATSIPYTSEIFKEKLININKSGKDKTNMFKLIAYPTNGYNKAVINSRFKSYYGLVIGGENILISGFIICSNQKNGIQIPDVNNCIIKNNILYDNKETGILLQLESCNIIVSNNICYGTNQKNGIVIQDNSTNNLIKENHCYNNLEAGIKIGYGANKNKIIDNLCNNNDVGIHMVNYAEDNIIYRNISFSNNLAGIRLSDNCYGNLISINKLEKQQTGILIEGYSEDNIVSANICKLNFEDGIKVTKENGYNLLTQNDIYSNNKNGIMIDSTTGNIEIKSNNCYNNKFDGIHLYSNNKNNIIIANNLIKNSNGIYISAGQDNIIKNNICDNNKKNALYLGRSLNNLIQNNVFKNVEYGINIGEYCSNNYIYNNSIFSNINGIYLYSAGNNIIKSNQCYYITGDGIYLRYSKNNKIEKNICFKNSGEGIKIDAGSEDNQIINNISYSNFKSGIYITYDLDNCIINSNICYNNNNDGIFFLGNNFNHSLIKNNLYNNNNGIYLSSGNKNIILGNNCFNNTNYGIYFSRSESNKIQNNILKNNLIGIMINEYSSNNIVSGNTLFSNSDYGIYSYYSANNDIISNTVTGPFQSRGIFLKYKCSGFIIRDNIIKHNTTGIYFDNNCNYNLLSGNSIYSNMDDGIYFTGCRSNIIDNNLFFYNNRGINIFYNQGIMISDNQFYKNNDSILLSSCSGYTLTIIKNLIYNAENSGIYIYHSDKIDILNNTIVLNKTNGIKIESWSGDINIYNNIIQDNAVYGINSLFVQQEIKYTAIPDNINKVTIGKGCITEELSFKSDIEPYDFHLTSSSKGLEDSAPNLSNTNIRAGIGRYSASVKQLSTNSMEFCFIPLKNIPADAKILLTFPVEFNLNSINIKSDTIDGDFIITQNNQSITILRQNGTLSTKGIPHNIIITNIIASQFKQDYKITYEIQDNSSQSIEKEDSNDFEWKKLKQVTISDFSPKAGPPGTIITIIGEGFYDTQGQGYVSFNGEKADFYYNWSDTIIDVVVPANAITGPITVENDTGNQFTTVTSFTVKTTGIIHYVSKLTNNPVSPYLTPTTAATNIQDAIDISGNGDYVYIIDSAPNYTRCQISELTNFTLKAINNNRPTIIATKSHQIGFEINDCKSLDIANLRIKDFNGWHGTGMYIDNSDKIKIKNIIFESNNDTSGNGQLGINSKNSIISDSVFKDTPGYRHIYLGNNAQSNLIINCKFTNGKNGVEFSDDINVKYNSITRCIFNNQDGYAINFPSKPSFNDAISNRIYNSKNHSIRLWQADYVDIKFNIIFKSSQDGVYVFNSLNCLIRNNSIISNLGNGVYFKNPCTSSTLRNNIIAYNNNGIYNNWAAGTYFDYNDVYNNQKNWVLYGYGSIGVNSISNDAMFKTMDMNNNEFLHLKGSSPCIDAGDPNDPIPIISGGTRIDMGAIEYDNDNTPPIISLQQVPYYNSTNVILNYTVSDDYTPPDQIIVSGDNSPYTTEGLHNVTLTAEDLSGNISSTNIQFLIDKTPPVINVTGVVDNGLYANPVNIVVTIADLYLQTNIIKLNGVEVGNIITISNEGNYTLYVYAEDYAGNISTTLVNFSIDKSAPVITVTGVSEDEHRNSYVQLNVSVFDPNISSNVAIISKENAPIFTTYFLPFSTVISNEGSYNLYVYAEDKLGHSNQTNISFIIDKTSPIIELQPVPYYNASNVTLSYIVSDNYTPTNEIIITGDNGPYTTEGIHNVTLQAQDKAGNISSTNIQFLIDKTPPIITLTPVSNYNSSDVTLNYSITDNFTAASNIIVTGDNSPYTTEGVHNITLTAKDETGNISITNFSFVIDKTPPTIAITGAANNEYYNTDVTPIITVTDINLNSYASYLNGSPFTSGTPISAEGNYTLLVDAVDKAGNTANKSLDFGIDKTTPVVNISEVVEGGEYTEATPEITAIDTNLSKLDVYLNDNLEYTTNAINSTITYKLNPITQIGDYNLKAIVKDKASNTNQAEVNFKIVPAGLSNAVCFYANYNTNADATFSLGDGECLRGGRLTKNGKGFKNIYRALDASKKKDNTVGAEYTGISNINLEKGTVLMWINTKWKKPHKKGRYFFTVRKKNDSGDENEYTMKFGVNKWKGTVLYIKDSSDNIIVNNMKNIKWYKEKGWHHIGYTWDSALGVVNFYIDGEIVKTITNSSWSPAETGKMWVGNLMYKSKKYAKAKIDEFTIYNRCATAGELKEEYNKQRTIYVDAAYYGLEDGSKERPYNTIKKALKKADDRIRIKIKSGEYIERLHIKKDIELIGEEGVTIKYNKNTDTIVKISSHIGQILMQNIKIDANYKANYGIKINTQNCVVSNCWITKAKKKNIIITGGKSSGLIRIIRCVIEKSKEKGVYINNKAEVHLINNTIVKNGVKLSSNHRMGIYVNHKGNKKVIIMNNIIYANGKYGIRKIKGKLDIQYNDVYNQQYNYYNCSAGIGDISVGPKFVDEANSDYHLKSTSPCIDAGNPAGEYNDPDGTRNDIGKFWYISMN